MANPPDPIKLQLKPGINRETTDYGNTGGWYDCNLTRWISKTPCSMGGWQRFTADQAQGTFRSLFPFSKLSGTRFYGAGTNLKYYLVYGNSLVDITPLRLTTDPMASGPFATASGTKVITVTDTANGAVMGDFVTYSGATGPFGGIPASDINQEHQITSIVDADTYTINVATTASSSTSGGGNVVLATGPVIDLTNATGLPIAGITGSGGVGTGGGATAAPGGAGGVAGTGDETYIGSNGNYSWPSPNTATTYGIVGTGGYAPTLGGGNAQLFVVASGGAGTAGTSYGQGGNGAPGIVIITEFCSA